MIEMNRKKKTIILLTVSSALFFCALVIISSLSSFAKMGPHANQFGSYGMWAAIKIALIFYLIPLLIYLLGIDQMKIVMTVFCALGMIMALTIILLSFIIFGGKFTSSLTVVVGLSLAFLMINTIWLIVAFHSLTIKTKFIE